MKHRDPLRSALRTLEGKVLQELCRIEETFGVRLDVRLVRDGRRLVVVAIDPEVR